MKIFLVTCISEKKSIFFCFKYLKSDEIFKNGTGKKHRRSAVNNKCIKNIFFCNSRYTVIFLSLLTKLKPKKKKNKRNRELWVCLTTLVWKDYINLLLPWMLMQMQIQKKKLYPLTLEIFVILYFKVPPAWLRADHTHMRKQNPFIVKMST